MLRPWLVQRLGLTDSLMSRLFELPGTCQSLHTARLRLLALSEWRAALERGCLPFCPSGIEWPDRLFSEKVLRLLGSLAVPGFTRRHPAFLDSVLHQVLNFLQVYEEMQKDQQKSGQGSGCCAGQGHCQNAGQDQCPHTCPGSSGHGCRLCEQDQAQTMQKAAEQLEELKLSLDPSINCKRTQSQASRPAEHQSPTSALEQSLDEMMESFKRDWEAMTCTAQVAEEAFGPEAMEGGGRGHSDFASALWGRKGWKELARLQRLLEESQELQDLVQSLGRSRGQSQKQLAPQQLAHARGPSGMIRSPLAREETDGICRSGELSHMMPSEMQLIAAGWPRGMERRHQSCLCQGRHGPQEECRCDCCIGCNQVATGGLRAARMLHMARRAERNLLSYEQTGWLENEPAKTTNRREMRPATKAGPIVLCLDTSGSMQGVPEIVAKAVTLQCMRFARKQRRRCYLYAFSGPGQTEEKELGAENMTDILDFLEHSFSGGTDLQAPLELSLDRLQRPEWALADVLLVTDGDVPYPDAALLGRIREAEASAGAKLHGLLVTPQQSEVLQEHYQDRMAKICSHVHSLSSACKLHMQTI